MTLRKFRLTFHLTDNQVIELITDGLSLEAVDAALRQKFSQRHFILIPDGDVRVPDNFSNRTDGGDGNASCPAKYLRIATEQIHQYRIEEVEAGGQILMAIPVVK